MRHERFEMINRDNRLGKFEIALKGESSILLPAERAVLSVEVSRKGHDKQAAAKDVVEVARKLETLLRKLGPQRTTAEAKETASVDYWSRTSLTESSIEPFDSERRVHLPREYTARIDFDAHFQKFQAISEFITDLSALPHNSTQPVKWILKEETKEAHRSGLRVKAAKDAFNKAKDYAIAMGYEKVTPLELHEAQLSASTSNRKRGLIPTDGVERSRKNLAEADEGWEEVGGAVFEYQPEDIKISVQVEASFFAE